MIKVWCNHKNKQLIKLVLWLMGNKLGLIFVRKLNRNCL